MNDYPDVDLSIMLSLSKCAIRAKSEYEAIAIVANAKEQFPDRTKTWDTDTYWRKAEDDGLCYTMFDYGETEPSCMTYTNYEWFVRNGYVIVDFEDLVAASLSDIEESDQDIKSLIGDFVRGKQ